MNLVRFERTASTFAGSRSNSTELQVQRLAEGTGLEPASVKRGSFQDYCLTKLGYPSEIVLVHVVGLAPTKSLWTPDLQSGAFAAQPHMQNGIDLC